MKSVGAAVYYDVELPTRRMPELRGELVLQEGEIADRIGGNVDERSGDALIVIVDPFDGEVVVAGTLPADRRGQFQRPSRRCCLRRRLSNDRFSTPKFCPLVARPKLAVGKSCNILDSNVF